MLMLMLMLMLVVLLVLMLVLVVMVVVVVVLRAAEGAVVGLERLDAGGPTVTCVYAKDPHKNDQRH
jgi:hypothetical protein